VSSRPAPDHVLGRPPVRHLLLQVGEGLDGEDRHDVSVEERVEPDGLVEAQRLERRLSKIAPRSVLALQPQPDFIVYE
jgi:hypothetical protein